MLVTNAATLDIAQEVEVPVGGQEASNTSQEVEPQPGGRVADLKMTKELATLIVKRVFDKCMPFIQSMNPKEVSMFNLPFSSPIVEYSSTYNAFICSSSNQSVHVK